MVNNNYLKVGCAIPICHLGKPIDNALEIIKCGKSLKDASIVLFPEMSLTGYNLGDWVVNSELLNNSLKALKMVVDESNESVWLVGGPYNLNGDLYNVCYVIQNKKILGIVPKMHLSNYREFNDGRSYKSGLEYLNKHINVNILGFIVPFGMLLFKNDIASFGVEICEDLWQNYAPHIDLYNEGANIIFNLSSSTFSVGKSRRRVALCENASFLGSGAYVYTSTGITETTSDVFMAGHMIATECGEVLLNHEALNDEEVCKYVDIDLTKIQTSKLVKNAYQSIHKVGIEVVPYCLRLECDLLKKIDRNICSNPFSLKTDTDKENVIDVLSNALYYRLKHIGIKKVVLGVSGGLDSTLALLICNRCFEKHNLDKSGIIAITMPGLGTGSKSKNNAYGLCNALGINLKEIDIKEEAIHHFNLIGKNDDKKDVTYENIQARYRTLVLMNLANLHGAIVVGTGDMSEIALGWSTFNGDQMSMYNLNGGLPKTIIRELTSYFIKLYPSAKESLQGVIDLPISPELTGSNQLTEDMIGKYEINDFLMYHVFNDGASRDRIASLIHQVFSLSLDDGYSYYDNFMKRFIRNQFKRLTGPESVKIFEFSFGPRSDYKFPGDMKY